MSSNARVFIALLGVLALGTGCGAARSTKALVQAQSRLQSTKSYGAETAAPYEYTLGVEFLRKAQEEWGYSDYKVSERLAQQAQAILAEAGKQASGAGPKKDSEADSEE